MADLDSSQDETDHDHGNSPQKRVAKKKYYPFGTPSHVNHAFSEFSHLPVTTRNFAMELATATDIKADVVEEAPERKPRRTVAIPKKKSSQADDDGEDEDEGSKSKAETSELAPCTKIPCQLVIRAIADIEYKNEVEKLDLEDETERLFSDLKAYEQDVASSEQRLEQMTEFGNQLEIKFNQIMSKVEQLEKTKEQLMSERTEINSKLMLLEVERQKANRRLDKASKQLADARWRKKKKSQLQDVEQGLSFPPSEIAENKILQADEKTIQSQIDIYTTPAPLLVSEKAVDLLEKPLPVKTVPTYLQEKFFEKPEAFDHYTTRHYEKLIQHSLDSWKHTEGTTLAHSVDTTAILHPYDPSSQRHFRKKVEESLEDLFFQDRSPVGKSNRSLRSSITSPKSLSNPHTLSASISSLGLGSSLGSPKRSSRVSAMSAAASTNRLPPRETWKSKSLSVLESIHTLIQHSEEKIMDDVSVRSGVTHSDSHSLDSHSQQFSENHFHPKPKKAPYAPSVKNANSSLASVSLLSERQKTKKYLKPLIAKAEGPYDLSQDKGSRLDPDLLHNFLDTLAEDGIYLGEGGIPLGLHAGFQEKKLDSTFYKHGARSSWGRKGTSVGIIRSNQSQSLQTDDSQSHNTFNEEDTYNGGRDSSASPVKANPSGSSVVMIRGKGNGAPIIDYRSLPKLTPKTLTVKHPHMKTFENSIKTVSTVATTGK